MNKGTSDTDSDFDKPSLPTGWLWVTLQDIAKISGGITKGKKRHHSEKVRMVPYLRVANVQRGYFDLSEVKEIEATESEIKALRLQPGDILFNEGGDRDKLGRGWVWNGELDECVHQNHVFRARVLYPNISPKFISFYANSEGQRYFMEHAKQTTNLASINLTKLSALPIPLPPVAEQCRIVAQLEKHFTRLDAGVAALRRIQIELKRYRSAVLKAACEGRLVPNEVELAKAESRPVETGEVLLARTLTERCQNWQGRGKYKAPEAPNLDGFPHLPEGWVWATVDQIASVALGKMLDKTKQQSGVKRRYLRNINVRWGWVDTDNCFEMFFKEDEIERFSVRSGDVLVCEGGEPGRAAIWDGRDECMMYQKAIHRVRFFGPFQARYLVIVLEFYAKTGWLDRWFTGSTIKHFTRESFVTLPIPLPPLTEQTRIVAEVERRLSVVENLQIVVTDNLQRAARMRQAVLRLAFAGQLVSQDQSDKPVSLNLRAKESPPPPISTHRLTSRKRTKVMSNKPAATLNGLLECLDSLGGSSAPERLFMALKFGNDVEAFFDLLRQGKNEGVLNVPVGNGGIIRRASHAS